MESRNGSPTIWMRSAGWGAGAVICASLLIAAAPRPTPTPIKATLSKVRLSLPSRDLADVELLADKALAPGLIKKIKIQRLVISGVVIPNLGEPVVAQVGDATSIKLKANLREVPASLMDVDEQKLGVRWEGQGRKDELLVVVEGVVNAQDPDQVERPDQASLQRFGQLLDYSISPGLRAVTVRARGRAYNPMGFEVVIESLEYTLSMGGERILAGKKLDIHLPPQKETEIKIEQDVGLGNAAGALAGLASGERAVLDGIITLRTPKGHRAIPIKLERGLQ